MDRIIVLDFGSQYSHLICRRLREANVYCELLPHDTPAKLLGRIKPKGIIISGGPSSIYLKGSPRPDYGIFDLGIPILGICYGHQLIVDRFGGKIRKSTIREYGSSNLVIDDHDDLFSNIAGNIRCWMSHTDTAELLPEDFEVLAHTDSSSSAAIVNRKKKLFGIQFHPEVLHTERGTEILRNFSFRISGATPAWNVKDYVDRTISEIRKKVGTDRVLCAVSGGIDSTTVAVLLHRAVGDNLRCVFVNHGLLRLGEEELVVQTFEQDLKIPLIVVNASERFITRLRGIKDPERKRMIIGDEFARVFADVAAERGPFQWLAQGTLYPDIIESGVSHGPASVIKSHHNVKGLPKWLNLKVIEPLSTLYKDEVKGLAAALGVPEQLLKRHPFPGPGLAVRILGEVNHEKIRITREASRIVEDELIAEGWYDKVWQAYAAVGDDKAVGVIGDGRLYGYIAIIRVVDSVDAMTADWVRLPYDVIGKISNRISNEVEGVTWVTYAVSSKPPATIEPQ
ncbi:MAG TPA: glutamine-hydrolyzing GMP synthase [Nitrososphaeraceae archaeon]|nr:glutamine-hydrolyzing GMP synthase [Nitrososphaeraceae archaeon]